MMHGEGFRFLRGRGENDCVRSWQESCRIDYSDIPELKDWEVYGAGYEEETEEEE